MAKGTFAHVKYEKIRYVSPKLDRQLRRRKERLRGFEHGTAPIERFDVWYGSGPAIVHRKA